MPEFWTFAAYACIIMGGLLMGLIATGKATRFGRSGRKLRHYTFPTFVMLWGVLIFKTSGFAFAQQSNASHVLLPQSIGAMPTVGG